MTAPLHLYHAWNDPRVARLLEGLRRGISLCNQSVARAALTTSPDEVTCRYCLAKIEAAVAPQTKPAAAPGSRCGGSNQPRGNDASLRRRG
jgi:hypothetical protein